MQGEDRVMGRLTDGSRWRRRRRGDPRQAAHGHLHGKGEREMRVVHQRWGSRVTRDAREQSSAHRRSEMTACGEGAEEEAARIA
jgi:hypothetical protein